MGGHGDRRGNGRCGSFLTGWKNPEVLIPIKKLEQVRGGQVDLAFRRWRKPTVKQGGRLRTAVGELRIGHVETVDATDISDTDALRAGYGSADDLRAELFRVRTPGSSRGRSARPDEVSVVYRVEISYEGEDPRIALRVAGLTEVELAEAVAQVGKLDARSVRGPWVATTLALIERWPARRAPELAAFEGLETAVFKAGVRKLKEIGLTESLRVGYQLSPRGQRVLDAVRPGPLRQD